MDRPPHPSIRLHRPSPPLLTWSHCCCLPPPTPTDSPLAEGVEDEDEGVWMDGEDNPHDDFRYNGEGKKNWCMNREHAEDIFEAKNCNISKVRSESRNIIVQSKTQANPIYLIQTAHPQFRALNSRHKSDMHSQPDANQRKKSESSALAAAVQPTPKRDSVPRHWWKTSSSTALADDQRRLLKKFNGTYGVIDGKL